MTYYPMKNYPIDAETIARAMGQAAIAADTYLTQWDQGDAAATDFVAVVNVEAIDIASNNETYTFRVTGSNVADRSDAQVLAEATLGAAAGITLETVDTAAGDRAAIHARSEKNGTIFRYIDVHVDVGGTSPSITCGVFFSKGVHR